MNRISRLVAGLVVFCAPATFAGPIRAGFAERDITPDVGMEVPGGYGKSFSKRIHDPCKVRAAVFDNGTRRVALVGLDALLVPRPLVLAVRREIARRCGIEDVLVAASHSHSSGPIGMVQPGEFDHASREIQTLAYAKSSCADPGYLKKVESAIIEAVTAADASRTPGTVGFGCGREDQVGFNRRIRMRNGLSFSHPGKGNPDNVEFAGPTDPEVGVVGFWNPDGQLEGCLVNFACHATASGPWISANWLYYMEKAIQGFFGSQAKVLFLQGACGDVTQVNNLDPHANPESDAWSQQVGGRVGAEAVKVLLGMSQTRVAELTLDVRKKEWKIARRKPSQETLESARKQITGSPSDPNWIWAKETLLLDASLEKAQETEVEVQVIQLGPVVCVTNPAEYFCALGLEIKRESGFPITFPVELANGCVGYVPTEEAFGPHGGGYETRLTLYSNLEITAGTQMARAGITLARSLNPSPLPTRPPAPPFKQPWLYGNQPPQLR